MSQNQKAEYNDIEQEIIILSAAWDLIDNMVNFNIFVKPEETENVILLFSDANTAKIFNIFLADFLSGPSRDFNFPSTNGKRSTDSTILHHLSQVCESPQMNHSAEVLSGPVNEMRDWLEAAPVIKRVWLPTIQREIDIACGRIKYLKICGTIAKHSFFRLGGVVNDIAEILSDNGAEIDFAQGMAILEEFYDWFSDNQIEYHSTKISELLNEIRWGIYFYLQPSFEKAYEEVPNPEIWQWKFNPPDGCAHPVALKLHWDLMGAIMKKPYFPRFKTSQYAQMRY